jgi:hypothetical protein
MQIPTSLTPGENQVREVTADDQVERLVIELVGDLAAYRPGAKVVIFEGGGDIEFDVRMTSLLFPEFIDKVNSVAGGNRAQVRALHEVLEKSGSLGARFYSISDQDASELPPATESRAYSWDRYHVENYLLQEEYILKAARELSSSSNELSDVSKTKEALREAARETLPVLVRHRLIQASHNALIREIRVGAQRENDLIEELVASISGSLSRARQLAETTLSRAALESTRERTRKELESDLESDQWLLTFRGRDVLKRFIGRFVRGVGYEVFRDLVVARMRDDGYQPPGMQEVLGKILADPFP